MTITADFIRVCDTFLDTGDIVRIQVLSKFSLKILVSACVTGNLFLFRYERCLICDSALYTDMYSIMIIIIAKLNV